MKGPVIVLPVVRRSDEEPTRRTQIHISLAEVDYRRLCRLAAAWGSYPRQTAQDLLRETIQEYARPQSAKRRKRGGGR